MRPIDADALAAKYHYHDLMTLAILEARTLKCGACAHWGGRNADGRVVAKHASCDLNIEFEGGDVPVNFGCAWFKE